MKCDPSAHNTVSTGAGPEKLSTKAQGDVHESTEHLYEVPLNDIEFDIADLWSEILSVNRVGRSDNFLLLGGESLAATQAASRIRAHFGCEISLRSILVGTV